MPRADGSSQHLTERYANDHPISGSHTLHQVPTIWRNMSMLALCAHGSHGECSHPAKNIRSVIALSIYNKISGLKNSTVQAQEMLPVIHVCFR